MRNKNKTSEDASNLEKIDADADASSESLKVKNDSEKMLHKTPKLGSFDKIDPSQIPEFKPTNKTVHDSDPSSPIYINHIPHDLTQYAPPPHPHLYLYSPSDNSLIPCEEIIIPNHGMSPEYSGTTNIYLAYPVQSPEGRGYITHPFTPPSSYMSQDSPGYQYEGTNSYSSTPHTHHSGEIAWAVIIFYNLLLQVKIQGLAPSQPLHHRTQDLHHLPHYLTIILLPG